MYRASCVLVFKLLEFHFFLNLDHDEGEGRSINNDVLKFKKALEYESSCIVIWLSHIYLIIDGKRSLIIKQLKN